MGLGLLEVPGDAASSTAQVAAPVPGIVCNAAVWDAPPQIDPQAQAGVRSNDLNLSQSSIFPAKGTGGQSAPVSADERVKQTFETQEKPKYDKGYLASANPFDVKMQRKILKQQRLMNETVAVTPQGERIEAAATTAGFVSFNSFHKF